MVQTKIVQLIKTKHFFVGEVGNLLGLGIQVSGGHVLFEQQLPSEFGHLD